MKILKLIYLTFVILCVQTLSYCDVHFIGLGRDCQPANELRHFKLRLAAYPFDWMVSHNFCGIVLAIQDNLEHFLDPALLSHKGTYIENSFYQFNFNHFFPLVGQPVTDEVFIAGTVVPNFLDYLPHVQNVQNRRIARLLNVLSSKKDTAVFVRTHATPDEAQAFVNMMKRKHPLLNYYLVVVHERQDLIGNWHIPHVLNFYASERSGAADWWVHAEWENVFNKVKEVLNSKKLMIHQI